MTLRAILAELDRASSLLAAARARFPRDPALDDVAVMLRQIRSMVEERWPLGPREAERVVVGRYAVRNLDPDMPELVDALLGIDILARGEPG